MKAFAQDTPEKQNLSILHLSENSPVYKKYLCFIIFLFTSKCIIQMSVCTTLTFLCWNLTITVSPVEFWRSTMSGLIWGGTTTESS